MSLNTERRVRLITTLSVIATLFIVVACDLPPNETTAGAAAPTAERITPPQASFPDGFVVDLELALTPEETANGLMFRPSLPENRGMLFIFDEPRRPAFWMKNMLIPLDLVFLDGAGGVVDLITDVQPCAADPCPNYPPSGPSLAVLEIGAGVAAAHGLEIGSTIAFERVPGYPARDDGEVVEREES